MRVLWLTPGFAANEADQNCIPPLQGLARALHDEQTDLHILSLGYPFTRQAYQWHGIPVRSAYGFNKQSARWINWIRMARYAALEHRRLPFDAIHSFWLGPCWLIGRFLAKRWGIRHITTLMGQDVLPANKYLRLLRPKHARQLVSLCHYHHERLYQSCGIEAEHCIRWGIDRSPDRTPPEARDIDVLGCGSMIALKNWDRFLHCLALLKTNRPDIRAVLIGDGVEAPNLRSLATRLGLDQNLTFAGHIPRSAVEMYMQRAKVLLHTADFESFGFVLVEAALAGCRVVSTPVGIATEIGQTAEQAADLADLVAQSLHFQVTPAPFLWHEFQQNAHAYLKLYENDR